MTQGLKTNVSNFGCDRLDLWKPLPGLFNVFNIDEFSIRVMYDFLLLLWFISLYLRCKVLRKMRKFQSPAVCFVNC